MADISKIQDLTGDVYNLKDAAVREEVLDIRREMKQTYIDLQGNLLPEFCEFPTQTGTPGHFITAVWNSDKTSAIITNEVASTYDNFFGLFDPLEYVKPDELDYNVEYTIHYTTTDPNVVLYLERNGIASEYTSDTTLNLQSASDYFLLAIKVKANSIVNATVTIDMPCMVSNLDLEKRIHNIPAIEIDNTLTRPDAAADAKVTGDAIAAAKGIISGGASGSFLHKNSNANYDVEWDYLEASDVRLVTSRTPQVSGTVFQKPTYATSTNVSYYANVDVSDGKNIRFTGYTTTQAINLNVDQVVYNIITDYSTTPYSQVQCKGVVSVEYDYQTYQTLVAISYYKITGINTVFTPVSTALTTLTTDVNTVNGKVLPSGGTAGQYLIKSSSTDYDAAWGTLTEGLSTTRSGAYSHAEGWGSTASGNYSHAEGRDTTASQLNAHAEGFGATASGAHSHAEGLNTTASGGSSHAEGCSTTASGSYSHAEGYYTTANHRSQHVFGEYNILDPSTETESKRGTYIEVVGNGTPGTAGANPTPATLSNARTLDWSGNEVLAGGLTVDGTAGLTIGSTTLTEAQLTSLLALLSN